MASGSFTGTASSNKYISWKCEWSSSSNGSSANSSNVTAKLYIWRNNTGYTTTGTCNYTISINGSSGSTGNKSSQTFTSSTGSTVRHSRTVTVAHNSDGTKTCTISVSCSGKVVLSGSKTVTLDKIARGATLGTITCTNSGTTSNSKFVSDGAISVAYSNPAGWKDLSFWLEVNPTNDHLCTRSITTGSTSGTLAFSLTDSEKQSLMKCCTTSTTGRLRVGMYSNSKAFTSYKDITYEIASSVVPTLTSITATGVNLFSSLYVQSKSSATLTINGASGAYGSTISSYSITGTNISYTGTSNSSTTSVLTSSGTVTFTGKITDSRGRTASKTCSITVYPYSPPSVNLEYYRCSSSGTKDLTGGTYIYAKPTITYSSVNGKNSITSATISFNDGTASSITSGTGKVYGTYALNTEVTIKISLTDSVGSSPTPSTYTVGVAVVPFNVRADKDGVGIGKLCETSNALEIAYDTTVEGKLTVTALYYNGQKIDLGKLMILDSLVNGILKFHTLD